MGVGIAAERGGGNGARRADRAADDAGRDVTGPEAGIVAIPAVSFQLSCQLSFQFGVIVPSALIAAIGHWWR